MDNEMNLMGAGSIYQFIKQSGYPIGYSGKNIFKLMKDFCIRIIYRNEGDIHLTGKTTIVGRYLNETTPIEVNLEHSHDTSQLEGGHAEELRYSLGFRLTLEQHKIPYIEVPPREKVAEVLRGKIRELEKLAVEVDPTSPPKEH